MLGAWSAAMKISRHIPTGARWPLPVQGPRESTARIHGRQVSFFSPGFAENPSCPCGSGKSRPARARAPETRPRGKEGRQSKPVVITRDPAIHSPILPGRRRAKIHKRLKVLELVEIGVALRLVIKIHPRKIQRVVVVGARPKRPRDFYDGVSRDKAPPRYQRIIAGRVLEHARR